MTRRLRLPTNLNVLQSDTVGFIRKLPHRLVEAFKAILEEVIEADLLLHVVDASHHNAELQIESVNQVLTELGAAGKPTLMVFNKVDKLHSNEVAGRFLERYPNAVAISALQGAGLDELRAQLGLLLRPVREFVELKIPHSESALIARLHEVTEVVERNYNGKAAKFKARIAPHLRAEFAPYIVGEAD